MSFEYNRDTAKLLKDICPFKLGVAVSKDAIGKHGDLIKSEFNSVTCENAMKLNYRLNKDMTYDFSEADFIHNYTISNGLNIRGHVFVWHVDFPQNIFGKLSRDELLFEIRRYIRMAAERYPQIYAWDVVNEIINDDSGALLKRTEFYNIIGQDYVEQIFRIAREELGENVALYWNEDDEWRPGKLGNILKYAELLVSKNVPIDGIGLQCHISPYEDLSEYRTLSDGIRRLKLKCQLTEMEVSAYDFDKGKFDDCQSETIRMQNDTYKYMFSLFAEYSDIIDYIKSAEDKCPEIVPYLADNVKILYNNQQKRNEAVKLLPDLICISNGDMDSKNVLWVDNQPFIIDLECLKYGNPFTELFELALCWSGCEQCNIDYDLLKAFISAYIKEYGKPDVDPTVLYYSNNGRLKWLEYNVKRALLIECEDEEEQLLGIEQVKETIEHITYYDKIREELITKSVTLF